MTYLDGVHAGLYALGVLTPLLAVVLLYVLFAAGDPAHRIRVWKLRRQVRRSGRIQQPDYERRG